MRTETLTAVDVHVHIESDGHGHFSLDDELMDASAKYFRADHDRTPSLEQIADLYRSLNMAAVVFTVDASTASGHPALSSEDILDAAVAHADVLIPFGSGDPLRGADAAGQARSPGPHPTGQAGIGAGLPGGRGIKLRLSDPMLVDDVAADFPELRIILAHPSVPWAASSISIAT